METVQKETLKTIDKAIKENLTAEIGTKIKLKLSMKNALGKVTDRGYMGITKKSGKNFVCDLSKEEATIFEVKKTKYAQDGYNTYEIKNGKYKKRWLDYHIGFGNGELFAESHNFFEFDIAIWREKDESLFALAGKKIAIPVRGTKEGTSMFVSEDPRYPIFYVTEEKQ
ncbi:hypothetical protein [uncultured Tenacibaculum sp.]|uniref:hypothetical protein n=1 Tax=uncultured Tenacibaculum sp. TaxID=174713 RepID=UPI00262BA0F8|nr:hypothetical protein [uncultured Tenacibaculum sp.]